MKPIRLVDVLILGLVLHGVEKALATQLWPLSGSRLCIQVGFAIAIVLLVNETASTFGDPQSCYTIC